jgi:cephalosporin hydroxylase
MTSFEVETFQNPFELDQLVRIFDHLKPNSILEIGAWHGGTLRYWIGRDTRVVVIDDQMRQGAQWIDWADDCDCDLRLLQGMSQDPDIVMRARELGPYDFVFIDGDHTADAVAADWMNYRPMVADGGVIALHDIYARPGYGVHDLWESIKHAEGTRYVEIGHNAVVPGNEGRCGIGMLWV